MTKKTFCPHCGSNKIKYEQINEGSGTWKCYHCGYEGSIVIEDGNLEKNIRQAKKMEKLSQKLSWRR
jgi:ribosomal protein L37AE/L43A